MSVERIDGKIHFLCDDVHCNEYIDCETGNFGEAVEVAKEAGWKIRNVNGAWANFCPDEDLDGLDL